MPLPIIDKHRSRFHALAARLARLRSTVTAFKLAAAADTYERPEIAWADLMRSLESMLPAAEDVEDYAASVLEDLQQHLCVTDHGTRGQNITEGGLKAPLDWAPGRQQQTGPAAP